MQRAFYNIQYRGILGRVEPCPGKTILLASKTARQKSSFIILDPTVYKTNEHRDLVHNVTPLRRDRLEMILSVTSYERIRNLETLERTSHVTVEKCE